MTDSMQVLAVASGKLPPTTDPRDLAWIHNGHVTGRYLPRLSTMGPSAARYRLNSYFKLVFVRHPLDRLVSAFNEKFSYNAGYKKRLGTRIIHRFCTMFSVLPECKVCFRFIILFTSRLQHCLEWIMRV